MNNNNRKESKLVEKYDVLVIDDDSEVTASIAAILSQHEFVVHSFSTPDAFLASPHPTGPACLIVDLKLPGMSGMDLLQKARTDDWHQPFIIVTGHGDIPVAVAAIKSGAVNFLPKPLYPDELVQNVRAAIKNDIIRLKKHKRISRLKQLMSRLTEREHQVLELVVQGLLNKQIAEKLSVSAKTVEAHRSKLTKKLEVDSVAQLVRLVVESQNG